MPVQFPEIRNIFRGEQLGGRFGYFYFFLLGGGGEGGSPRCWEGGGDFLLKIPGGGGFSRAGEGGGARGREGVCGEWGRGGLNNFFSGPKCPPRQRAPENATRPKTQAFWERSQIACVFGCVAFSGALWRLPN